jgi:hypothetical protein
MALESLPWDLRFLLQFSRKRYLRGVNGTAEAEAVPFV